MRLLLRNLSTSPDGRREGHRLLKSVMAALAVVCLAHPAFPIDPNRMLSQYMRDHWGSEQGFTGGSVTAIAQTTDGYLWIGTEKGLIRFDGLTFRLFHQAVPATFLIGPVQGLMADAQGNLWILLQSTKILRYHDGKFELGREEAEFGITSVSRRRDGTVLFSSLALGTLTYRAGKFEILTSPAQLAPSEAKATSETDNRSTRSSWSTGLAPHSFAAPNSAVISMAETTDGKVWLGTRDKGLFYMSEGQVFAAGKGLPGSKINCLLALENGELWIGTSKGVWHWNGTELTRAGVPSSLLHVEALTMIRDKDSNIWVGTTRGLLRFNVNGVSSLAREVPLSSGPVTAIFEDREGNLWIGGARGLERLRDSAFITYSVAALQSQSMGALFVDPEDKIWFAPNEGGLRWGKGGNGGVVAAAGLNQDNVYSITSSGKNELWVGRQRGGLTHLRLDHGAFTAKTYTRADGLAQDSVYAVYEDHRRTVWSGTLNAGVSELRNGHFTTYTTANGLASNTVSSIAEGADGTMWFGTPNGLSGLTKNGWRTYTVRDGLSSQDVNCLLRDSTGVLWIGTADGLAFLTAGHIQVPRGVPDSLREPILGVAEDRNGSLWVATASHVLQVKRSSLMGEMLQETDFHEYGLADGLPGMEGVKRYQSVVTDSQGQVWFSTNRGLSVVNPARPTVDRAPALVNLEAVLADGSPLDLRAPTRVSSAKQRTTFRYVGLSLGNSERVRYRYRLDGVDHAWSEATPNREATYANLGAGSYRFRVMASNSDGLWNGSEAAVGLEVEPTLWQTSWFRLGCLVCAGLATLLVYRLRMHQLTQLLNVRFEERLAERTRIARDLHDTLLQSFQGLLLRFQAAANLLPPGEAKQRFEGAIEQAAQAITEGRDAVQGLRSSTVVANDLSRAISTLGEELATSGTNPNSTVFHVEVEGTSQDLHPILRDEVYRIAGEAVRNAFKHAQAQRIEVEIRYDERQLRMRVRDDGKGIDPKLLSEDGRAGHFGLRGMRERAKLLGGRLAVWSERDSGTEVELRIPASRAYETSPAPRRSWLAEKFAGKDTEAKS
jgi:ligand-binding sensor domain-containing protein/signal transduction histidine kinase